MFYYYWKLFICLIFSTMHGFCIEAKSSSFMADEAAGRRLKLD
jgi:hypothetical protein